MIKLFVCDIDNTLLNKNVGLPQANLEAILALQKAGVIVALASGRINSGMVELSKELQLDQYGGYLIASNGAYVKSLSDGRILSNELIALDKLKEMADHIKRLGIHASIQQGDLLAYTVADEALSYDRDVIGLQVEQHDDLSSYLYEAANKVEVTGWFHGDEAPFDEFTKLYQNDYSLIRGRGTFLDVMPLGITKATGVAVVMKELHLKKEEVAAIGDGENDRHMLKAAGLSATLANARASLQEDVDHVVASVEQAGLSHFAHLVLLKNAN
jgi:Cof subfamily protein (haloacid dehalogenase superfamily)